MIAGWKLGALDFGESALSEPHDAPLSVDRRSAVQMSDEVRWAYPTTTVEPFAAMLGDQPLDAAEEMLAAFFHVEPPSVERRSFRTLLAL